MTETALRYARIDNGLVTGIIMADPEQELDEGSYIQSDTAEVGQLYADGIFSDRPPPQRYARISGGVVVNIEMAYSDSLPDGEYIQSDTARIGQLYADGVFTDPPPAPITTAQVNAERERRILVGATFYGVAVTGDPQTVTNLANLGLGASIRLGAGDTTTVTPYRDADNVVHELTPMQMLGLWQAAASYVSLLYQKSWALKEMEIIPQDYTDDSYWSVGE